MSKTTRPGDTVTASQMQKLAAGGYTFTESKWADDAWICATSPESVASKALALGWHEFVCWYVARATRKPVRGYTVRASANGYAIAYNGEIVTDRDASTVYSWFERLPLIHLSREADEARRLAHEAA